MQQSVRNILLAATAGAAALLASHAFGTARVPLADAGTRVASVSLPRVLEKLQERQEAEMQIAAMRNQFMEEANARRKKIEAGAKELESMPDSPEKRAKAEPLIVSKLELESWSNLRAAEIDYERSLMFRSIYRNLRSEASKLADAEGYDYVLVDDGTDDLTTTRETKMPLEMQVLEKLDRRRVLYASPKHDLTDKLIVRMNNARAAGTAAPAAPATPAAGAK